MNAHLAASGFARVFGRPPSVLTRAPGRVNLIGEHTDYNDGFVFPAAIGFATWTAVAPTVMSPAGSRALLRVHAGNRGETLEIDLAHPGTPRQRHWADYVRGMVAELGRDGHRIAPGDLWFAGDVPDGAGLSSSAALEMSVGLALLTLSQPPGTPVDLTRLALAGQRAEHAWAGTQCGIMDQFISARGAAGRALLLDCRSLDFRLLALPESLRLVICDTGVKHELAGGEYNARRSQCEEGVAYLRNFLPAIRALRDVSQADFDRFAGGLSDLVLRRCRHVISENARAESFAAALEAGRTADLGPLMAASHDSLRDDYEVSCAELDSLVELARQAPGVVGARMTGGGFGGCTVNLVEAGQVDAFTAQVSAGYAQIHGRPPRIFTTEPADGARVVPVPLPA